MNFNKIFCLGFQKTGTTSLCSMLNTLGYKTAHWGRHHRDLLAGNLTTNVFKNNDAFADLPLPLFYKELDEEYPNSKFILTIRDSGKWLKSCRKHQQWLTWQWRKPLADTEQFVYGVTHFNPKTFLSRYESHNQEILEYFKDRPDDLLVIDMTNGFEWSNLCEFLGHEIPEEEIPHKMKAKTK